MIFSAIASWSTIIYKALDAEGIDPALVYAAANADIKQIQDPNARVPMSVMTRLWAEAVKASSSPCFVLAAARQWQPNTFHAVGLAWFASPSLEAAFERFDRYSEMLNTAVKTRIEKRDGHFIFSIALKDKVFRPEGGETAIAVLIQMCRTSLGIDFVPSEVHLISAKSGCHQAFEKYFGCKVTYDHPQYELILPREIIERPLPTSNLELLKSADNIIHHYLENFRDDDIVSQVRIELMKQLPSGQATEESIANALHMSLRTLQRRLTDRNETYRSILNSVRKELALQYIATPHYSITEITYLLGFTEPSSFTRSFKRWTGNTPSQQRALNG